jgi:hypothetical protein
VCDRGQRQVSAVRDTLLSGWIYKGA